MLEVIMNGLKVPKFENISSLIKQCSSEIKSIKDLHIELNSKEEAKTK